MLNKPDIATDAARVLVVDDDPAICRLLVDALESQRGFAVSEADDGDSALEHFTAESPDLVILDLGLPGTGGEAVLRELRERGNVAVIILTARGDEADRVLGLERGADDYIVKPFSVRELIARVDSVLRRTRTESNTEALLSFDGLTIDPSAHEARLHDRVMTLTAREFDLLAFLASSPRQAFTRGQLLEHVWKSSPDWQDPSTVTEHIRRLRQKLEADSASPRWIVTVPGVGYRFEP